MILSMYFMENKTTTLGELAKTVHVANAKWWQDVDTGEPIKRNKGELLALIHSEISECFEGETTKSNDDKLPHRKMGEVEIVDTLIRTLDYAAGFGYDLDALGKELDIESIDGLNAIAPLFLDSELEAFIRWHGIVSLHFQVSKILEHERKGRFDEAGREIFGLIVGLAIYGHLRGYDLQGAFDEKMAYNATREDHKHEARKIAGGKQF